ncbi:MAG: SH3 domain-containing protein [Bdellovibrionota bacterium]
MTLELQNLFDQAIEAQSQSKDAEALELYKSINKKGFTSPALELNKATLYEKQEDWGRALSSMDKAQHLARSPWLASEKLENIQRQVSSNRAYSIGSLGELSQEVSKIIRPSESFFLATIFLGVFLLVRALGFKHRGYFFCVLAAVFFSVLSVLAISTQKTAYIITSTPLLKLPIPGSSSNFMIGKGSKVSVLSEKNSFVKIERPGDFEGWINSAALKDEEIKN